VPRPEELRPAGEAEPAEGGKTPPEPITALPGAVCRVCRKTPKACTCQLVLPLGMPDTF
jgi:hypothetical protein